MPLNFPPPKSRLDRRQFLVGASLAGIFYAAVPGTGWAQASFGSTRRLASPLLEQQWRVLSRLGYGLSPALLQSVQASDPLAWALSQIEAAHAASQVAARVPAELQSMAAPLPELFDGVKREREARASAPGKNTPDAGAEEKAPRPYDFSAPAQARYFTREQKQKAAAWQLAACSQPGLENPLLARMGEFWFNHFNVYAGKNAVGAYVGHYTLHVARAHALGKFEDLLLASARHPAMLIYLDQAQSVATGTPGRKGQPRGLNENYARELMELHTLGVDGGYTQAEVRALARILTGWTLDPKHPSGFRFASRGHDVGPKTLLGQAFGNRLVGGGESEGLDALRMLARHPSTAQRICQRMAEFFVADQPPPALVQRLRQTFLNTQGDIRMVMRSLVESPEFWNPEHRLFKTPLDFACSALTAAQSTGDQQTWATTAGFLTTAGQPLHGWQTPDGYKTDAATWLVPEALTRRVDFAIKLGQGVPSLDYLLPYLSAETQATLAQAAAGMRAGLLLGSPDFMSK